ncbi:MAG: MerR family transcriptional regulator [Myxococcota bacterium]|nr:MerR family transcriptional regulator [Myxococcota bacterium]
MAQKLKTSKAKALGPDSPIPDKLYFKIGEVAKLVGVQPHVLRYWEREVSSIKPGKTAANQRRYRRRDVELFRETKRLLYDEKFTLAGAKQRLSEIGSGRLDLEPKEGDSQDAAARGVSAKEPPGKKSEKLGARLENCEKLLGNARSEVDALLDLIR